MQKIKPEEIDFFFNNNNLFIQTDKHIFEKVVSIKTNKFKYKKRYEKNPTYKNGKVKNDIVTVKFEGSMADIPFYSGLISSSQIPKDFKELMELGDFLFRGDWEFDETMLREGLFEKGKARSNHRIITQKAYSLGYNGCIKLLTGVHLEAAS